MGLPLNSYNLALGFHWFGVRESTEIHFTTRSLPRFRVGGSPLNSSNLAVGFRRSGKLSAPSVGKTDRVSGFNTFCVKNHPSMMIKKVRN